MASRKENFWKYYSTPAGQAKLGGKSIDEAYAAMRAQVNKTGNRVAKLDSGSRYSRAVARRVATRGTSAGRVGTTNAPGKNNSNGRVGTTNSATPQRPAYKPLTVGDVAKPVARQTSRAIARNNDRLGKVGNALGGFAKDVYGATPKAKREAARKAAIERRKKQIAAR